MHHYRTIVARAALVLLVLLPGCVGPEKGEAELIIDKLGGYTFTYTGGMAYIVGLAAKASGKPISAKDTRGIATALQGLNKDKEFLSVTPTGLARVNVRYKAVRKPWQSFKFLGDASFISITQDMKTHRMTIQSATVKPKSATQLKQIGYKPDVSLVVKSDLPVIANNGSSQRTLFFGSTSYRWQVDLQRAPVKMVVKLPG